MFEKFKDISDDDLVFAYKQKRDEDIELELIDRYRIHAKKLAGEFYHKFRFLYLLEYDDIYSITWSTLFTAIKTFVYGGFFKFWKTIASNELNTYVHKFTVTKNDALVYSQLDTEISDNLILKQGNSMPVETNFLKSDIHQILLSNKDDFDDYDIVLYELYIEGYKCNEIAVIVGYSDSFVRRRLKKIKTKINNILFNQ